MSVVLLALHAPAVRSEFSEDEYRTQARPLDRMSRQKVDAELERARRADLQRARDEAAADAARVARQAAEYAARPLGERLIDARCSACHGRQVLEGKRRSELGWRLTVERMRWWHGAAVRSDEAGVITARLEQTQGSTAWPDEMRWLGGVTAVFALFAMRAVVRWRRAASGGSR